MRIILFFCCLGIIMNSCNSKDDNTEKKEKIENVVKKDNNIADLDDKMAVMYTVVENLRLRTEPNLSSEVVLTLNKNTYLYYLNEESEQKDSIKIDGETVVYPWYKVKILDKEIFGWVFGGGVRQKEISRIGQTQSNFYNMLF